MDQTPRKFLLSDLVNKQTPAFVWIQGTIEQTINNNTLIVSDGSGRAKIIKCNTADGIINRNSIQKGTYCCIIGTVVKTTDLTEIEASKIVDLTSNPQMSASWETEVKEANLFLQGKILPVL